MASLLSRFIGSENMETLSDGYFNKVIGFKSVVDGVGTSTIISNVAQYLASTYKLSVCVIDTHMCKHTQSALLHANKADKQLGLLDFRPGLMNKVLQHTSFKNVYFAGPLDSTEEDLISSRDNPEIIRAFVDEAKFTFNVILINLSNEQSELSDEAATICDAVIPVLTLAMSCLCNLQSFLCSLHKNCVVTSNSNVVIVNKSLASLDASLNDLLLSNHLTVITSLPFSEDIYHETALGICCMITNLTTSRSVKLFSDRIDDICRYIRKINSDKIKE